MRAAPPCQAYLPRAAKRASALVSRVTGGVMPNCPIISRGASSASWKLPPRAGASISLLPAMAPLSLAAPNCALNVACASVWAARSSSTAGDSNCQSSAFGAPSGCRLPRSARFASLYCWRSRSSCSWNCGAGRDAPDGDVHLLRHHVLEGDARVRDLHAGQVQAGGPAAARRGRLRGLAPVFPVALARGVLLQPQVESVDLDTAHFELSVQQRHQLHAHRRALQREEGLIAESLRIAEAGFAGFNRQPREHRKLELAGKRERAAGGVTHGGSDAILVVVGIEEQPDRHQAQHEQCHEPADHHAEYLEYPHQTLR